MKLPTSHSIPRPRVSSRKDRGFTLLELIVVIAMIGILASLAMPNLIQMPTRAKEAVLRTNLHTLRTVIDQFYGDEGFYPPTLEALLENGYLRKIPEDPILGRAEWDLIYDEPETDYYPVESDPLELAQPGVFDVKSLSTETAIDGTPYNEW